MNRKGGVPPIVVVLVVVAFLVSVALVGWYVITSTKSATTRTMLHVETGSYIVGNTLYITIRNDGTVDFNGEISVVLPTESAPISQTVNIPRGESVNLSFTLSGSYSAGQTIEGIVRTPEGEQRITVDVIG